MPNHGYCRNCWWWMPPSPEAKPAQFFNSCLGKCYMQSNGIEYYTTAKSYCPDYLNRKKGNKEETLDDWIKRKML